MARIQNDFLAAVVQTRLVPANLSRFAVHPELENKKRTQLNYEPDAFLLLEYNACTLPNRNFKFNCVDVENSIHSFPGLCELFLELLSGFQSPTFAQFK